MFEAEGLLTMSHVEEAAHGNNVRTSVHHQEEEAASKMETRQVGIVFHQDVQQSTDAVADFRIESEEKLDDVGENSRVGEVTLDTRERLHDHAIFIASGEVGTEESEDRRRRAYP